MPRTILQHCSIRDQVFHNPLRVGHQHCLHCCVNITDLSHTQARYLFSVASKYSWWKSSLSFLIVCVQSNEPLSLRDSTINTKENIDSGLSPYLHSNITDSFTRNNSTSDHIHRFTTALNNRWHPCLYLQPQFSNQHLEPACAQRTSHSFFLIP